MTTIDALPTDDQRDRWRSGVGLDCPAQPAANPRRTRYEGNSRLSWQHAAESTATQ